MTEKSAVNFECCNRFVRHEPPSRGHMGHGNPSPHRICHPVAGNSDRPATLGGWPTETVVREKYTFTCEIHDERGGFRERPFPGYGLWKSPVRTSPPNVRILRISIKQSTLLCVMAVTGFVSYTPVFVSYTSRHCDQGVPRQLRLSFLPPLPPVTDPACNRCPSRRTCAPPRARRE